MHTYISQHKMLAKRVAEGTAEWNVSELCNEVHCRGVSCNRYAHHAQLNREIDGIANFTQYFLEDKIAINKGEYVVHLERWLRYFNREQLFILNLSTLLTNTTDTVHRLLSFLNLPPFPAKQYSREGKIVLPHKNSAQVQTKFDCAVRTALYPHFAPHNARLYELLRQDGTSGGGSAGSGEEGCSGGGGDGGGDGREGGGGGGGDVRGRAKCEPPFPEFVAQPCSPGQLY
jgi:uncharacterized membrane protein YgcG